MQRDNVDSDLTALAFDFFFWFSRFEAALKENRCLKSLKAGDVAEPGWDKFVKSNHEKYEAHVACSRLLTLRPERQIVGKNQELTWRPVALDDCDTELAKVVRLLKTVRNNVFHGGKSGAAGWSQPARTRELLLAGTQALHELAALGGFEADYWQRY